MALLESAAVEAPVRTGRRAVLLAAALSVPLLLVILPPLLEHAGLAAAAATIREAFHPFCHQDPERSFPLLGTTLAVCVRCTGAYGGVALAGLLFPLMPRLVPDPDTRGGRLWLLLTLPGLLHPVFSKLGPLSDAPWLRGGTAMLASCALALLLCRVVAAIPAARPFPLEAPSHEQA